MSMSNPGSKVLVATDFSAPSERAIAEGIALAKALGLPIELVHVHVVRNVSLPPTLDIATRPPPAEEVVRGEQALTEKAHAVRAAGVACETFATFGPAADRIVERAREVGARLLVVGTHGHGFVRNLLLGSVAEKIVKAAPCPVLVVPPGAAG
jgi:nucleotide-binding universal stress UspA family protein